MFNQTTKDWLKLYLVSALSILVTNYAIDYFVNTPKEQCEQLGGIYDKDSEPKCMLLDMTDEQIKYAKEYVKQQQQLLDNKLHTKE